MPTKRPVTIALLVALFSTASVVQSARADAINWYSNLDAAKVEAARTGKLVLLHFWTKSCGPCKKLERDVFSQPQIGAAMQRDFVPVKIDADIAPAIANAYQISRVPTEVILTPQGGVVTKLSCPLDPTAYGTQLANVAQNYRKPVGNAPYPTQTKVNPAYAGLQVGQTRQQAVTASAAQPKPAAPAVPAVMQNPYFNDSKPVAPKPAPTIAAATAKPALPANAMPNSYRDRYAAATPPAPVKQEVPVAPPAAAAPPAFAAAPPAQAQTPAEQQVVAASAMTQTKPTWPPQLPPNTPPLAFEGYCPVSLKTAKKWVQGDQQFGAIHRGRTYLFTTDQQRQQFLANPDAYSPVFAGKDPVKLLDENQSVEGSRRFGFEYRGAFYLFSSKESMTRFASQPDRYAASVRQAMSRMDASVGGTIRK